MDFLTALGESRLAEFIQNTGYPYAKALHIMGASALFGGVVLLDLCILGRKANSFLLSLRQLTIPLIGVGFILAIIGGILLFLAQPQALFENDAVRIKLGLIVLAGINACGFEYFYYKNQSIIIQKSLAIFSLGLWIAVFVFASLIPYWG